MKATKSGQFSFPPEIEIAIEGISSEIQKYGKPVLMETELRKIFLSDAIKNLKKKDILSTLEQRGTIETVILKSDYYNDITRISAPSLNPTPYHYAISLRKGSYLSHSSSVYLLGLTQQQPKTVYVNKEQSKKINKEYDLSQESIDRAFSHEQRRSRYIYKIHGTRIVLLSGKATGCVGVENDVNLNLPRTCLERTLIDIVVRPRYAGGVFQVAEAFKVAINEIDFEKLLSLLKLLNYNYPYHQSLGFYLERAGADNFILSKLKSMGLNYDFYLDYSMSDPNFDNSWRVYFPLGV